MQFRGPKLYKKEGALFREESYLLRIFRSTPFNLHTFHLINIAVWRQIFFPKHGKSTPQRWAKRLCFGHRHCDYEVTMWVHESSHPITCCKAWKPHASNAIDRFWDWRCNGCRMPYGKIISVKTLKLHSHWGNPSTIVSPTCSWRHKDTR